jgi:hypothetical protein
MMIITLKGENKMTAHVVLYFQCSMCPKKSDEYVKEYNQVNPSIPDCRKNLHDTYGWQYWRHPETGGYVDICPGCVRELQDQGLLMKYVESHYFGKD